MNSVNVDDGRSSSVDEPVPAVVPRRERVRAATEAEILATARELLVAGGADALTLREVGRRMGMTASALYRYVGGHGDLVDRLAASSYRDLGRAVDDAVRQTGTGAAGGGGAAFSEESFAAGLAAASRAFRAWCLSHPAEFSLMFGGRNAPVDACPLTSAAGDAFGRVFLLLFARGAGVEPDESGGDVFTALPAPLDLVFARTWMRLLGAVMVEAAGQVGQVPVDPDRLFEAELADCTDLVLAAVRQVRDAA